MTRGFKQAAALVALLAGIVGTLRAQAPGGHAHRSPHKGEILEVANHHVEFKADSTGLIAVWLLDQKQKPLAPPSGATVTLMPASGEQVTLPLQVDAEGQRLTATFDPKKLTAFQAVVSMSVAGSKRNLRFHYPSH